MSTTKQLTKPCAIVVAQCPNRGIGFQGDLPWPKLPKDMARFKKISRSTVINGKRNAVVMGRKTWESIPEQFRPLPDRLNIVLTSTPSSVSLPPSASQASVDLVKTAKDLSSALLEICEPDDSVESIFLIGGEKVFNEGIESGLVNKIYMTRIGKQFECDVFFPEIDIMMLKEGSKDKCKWDVVELSNTMKHSDTSGDFGFDFVTFLRKSEDVKVTDCASDGGCGEGKADSKDKESSSKTGFSSFSSDSIPKSIQHDEMQYLDLIRDIVAQGNEQIDRTKVGTLSVFGRQLRFSLRDEVFPLLTTKRVFWRGVLEELLWFVRGDTNAKNLSDKGKFFAKNLSDKGVHIWDGNGSKEFLEKRGLGHREEGDLGPVYGFQWRHFGAEYKSMHDSYDNQGVDQVKEVIETLKKNPSDRRMIITAWNPAALSEMALPPCHMFCQFYVKNPNVEDPSQSELSCLMYQRSCDVGLGVPFNIASYACLTRMIAAIVGMKCGDFVHSMGNTHVYSNHVEPLMGQQVDRLPKPFPLLKIKEKEGGGKRESIDEYKFEDFELIGYSCHPKVAMEMAV